MASAGAVPNNRLSAGSVAVQGVLWSERADDWARYMEPQMQPLYDAIIERASPLRGRVLLDAGCGSGGLSREAFARGARVSGYDAAPALIAIARERCVGPTFEIGDLEELPYTDEWFDVVVGVNSFQYCADPVAALREAHRVSKPRAKLFVAAWGRAEDCEATSYISAVNSVLPAAPPGAPGPFALSEDRALASLVESAGFRWEKTVDVQCEWRWADQESALRGMLAAGPAVRAIRAAGENRIRELVIEAIAPYRTSSGGYSIENVFRFVVARA